MATPNYQATGTNTSATGSTPVSPPWPATVLVDDLAFLPVQTQGGVAVVVDAAQGFVEVGHVETGTGAGSVRLTLYWCRATSTIPTAPTIHAASDHIWCRMFTIRNAINVGTPWEMLATSLDAVGDTAVSIPGGQTFRAKDLILLFNAHAIDSAASQTSGQANPDLAAITEKFDGSVSAGTGGGATITTATGNTTDPFIFQDTTATLAASSKQVCLTLAILSNEVIIVPPDAGAGSYTGFAPTVSISLGPKVVTPGSGVGLYAGFPPALPRTAKPDVGAGAFTGFAPSVVVSAGGAPVVVPMSTGVGTYTGFAPLLPGIAPKVVTPNVGAGTYTGFAPLVLGSQTAVEQMDAVAAVTLRRGLGFSVNPSQLWEFALAKAAGATEVRMQFDWPSVETAPGVRALTATQIAALDACVANGLQPLIVAAYGPGWVDLGTFTLAATANIGDFDLVFNESVAAVEAFFGTAVRTNGTSTFINATFASAPAGAMIKAVNVGTKTVTLAAPIITVALPPGSAFILRRRHYRAPGTVTGGTDTNGAIAHYTDYVQFLAQEISNRGLTGRVEIWNEPPAFVERWQGGEACFDSLLFGGGCNVDAPYGFAQALFQIAPPPGVRWSWGGTHLSGFRSLIGANIGTLPTQSQVEDRMAVEEIHPYHAFSPEMIAYYPNVMRSISISDPNFYTTTSLPGSNVNSNYKYARKLAINKIAADGWAPEQSMSEGGYNTTDRVSQARYYLRTYLCYLSLGYTRWTFYRLANISGSGFTYEVVDGTTQVPFAAYTAMKNLLADMDALGTGIPMVTPLPTVTAYVGAWPLMVVPVVGSSALLLTLWQRTYATAGQFSAVASPTPSVVTVAVPDGLRVTNAINLRTRASVAVGIPAAGLATVTVADDPVALAFESDSSDPYAWFPSDGHFLPGRRYEEYAHLKPKRGRKKKRKPPAPLEPLGDNPPGALFAPLPPLPPPELRPLPPMRMLPTPPPKARPAPPPQVYDVPGQRAAEAGADPSAYADTPLDPTQDAEELRLLLWLARKLGRPR